MLDDCPAAPYHSPDVDELLGMRQGNVEECGDCRVVGVPPEPLARGLSRIVRYG